MTVPTSAYRIMLKNGTTFSKAAAAVPYLEKLGVDSLSVSSVFNATDAGRGRRSFDPTRLDRDSGGEEGFVVLDSALSKSCMGLLVDINPNQMPVSHENAWWFDILEWGPKSRYAAHFDIDWKEPLTLPVLARPFVEEVQAEKFELKFDSDTSALGISYLDGFYPLSPKSYQRVLRDVKSVLAKAFLGAAAKATPLKSDEFHARLRQAHDESELSDRLELAARLNRISTDISAFQDILAIQDWCLLTEPDARRHLNYRHSFDSLHAASVRVEMPSVFEDFHKIAMDLVKVSQVTGFRINQIDGLSDPETYLQRLRDHTGSNIYLVTDKILLDGEQHPATWPVEGTAGYEFVSAVANVLVDHGKLAALEQLYNGEVGMNAERSTHYRNAKSAILHKKFAPELQALGDLLISIKPGVHDDLEIRRAISSLIVELPVFRTYANETAIQESYRSILRSAASEISSRVNHVDDRPLRLVLRVLESKAALAPNAAIEQFTIRFQQLAAGVMAQAIEESYRYDRGPIALDEITLRSSDASDPVQAFHRKMIEKATSTPKGMVATTFSHATKFGEDARMRLLALSEAPEVWCDAVSRWRKLHAGNVATIEEAVAPDPETEWLIYQTLAAIWPLALRLDDEKGLEAVREDLATFIARAMRETQKRAFWTEINKPYELAVMDYVSHLFSNRGFLLDFIETMRPYWVAGAINSFSQTVLKMTAPGIPVVYNGSEIWDFSVSNIPAPPDLDFEAHAARLSYADQRPLNILLEDWHSGAIKQRLVAAHLRARKGNPGLFLEGDYTPLIVTGKRAENIIAFLRKYGSTYCLVAALRLSLDAVERFHEPFMPIPAWEDTTIHLPPDIMGMKFRDITTGNFITLSDKLIVADGMRSFPGITLISDLAN